MLQTFLPSCWSPTSVRHLSQLLVRWGDANPGKRLPKLILDELPAVRARSPVSDDSYSDDEQVPPLLQAFLVVPTRRHVRAPMPSPKPRCYAVPGNASNLAKPMSALCFV